jgi:hypothetical protein
MIPLPRFGGYRWRMWPGRLIFLANDVEAADHEPTYGMITRSRDKGVGPLLNVVGKEKWF